MGLGGRRRHGIDRLAQEAAKEAQNGTEKEKGSYPEGSGMSSLAANLFPRVSLRRFVHGPPLVRGDEDILLTFNAVSWAEISCITRIADVPGVVGFDSLLSH